VRRVALLVGPTALALAGCGGAAKQAAPKPPHLPRALAQAWAQQADGVARALAAGESCTAQQLAGTLHAEVVQAVNARQIPRTFEASLLATANDLTGRITCTPPPQGKPKHGHKHGKHGGGD
jgi:hypothetical protein